MLALHACRFPLRTEYDSCLVRPCGAPEVRPHLRRSCRVSRGRYACRYDDQGSDVTIPSVCIRRSDEAHLADRVLARMTLLFDQLTKPQLGPALACAIIRTYIYMYIYI